MDTLPLPPRPDLAQYRKRAKELVKVSGDSDAVRTWANEWLQTLERLRGDSVSPFVQGSFDRAVDLLDERARENITLADAQFLIARAHGFKGWRDFARHVERLSHEDGDTFESGADAVVGGELAALESLLRREPDLVHARSPREHRATLLHYVAANGVEDFRQLTPPNAVEVARMLLDAGADVDALAETYGGGSAQTTLNLLVSSAHPAEAGLQAALVDTLADHGAAINGLEDDASPLMTALAFGYVDTADALVRRGARIDNVVAAAALGRSELVERMLSEGVKVAPSLVNLYWLGLSDDPSTQVERAREWAAAYGHTDVVRLLAERG